MLTHATISRIKSSGGYILISEVLLGNRDNPLANGLGFREMRERTSIITFNSSTKYSNIIQTCGLVLLRGSLQSYTIGRLRRCCIGGPRDLTLWTMEGRYSYGKYVLYSSGAHPVSIFRFSNIKITPHYK